MDMRAQEDCVVFSGGCAVAAASSDDPSSLGDGTGLSTFFAFRAALPMLLSSPASPAGLLEAAAGCDAAGAAEGAEASSADVSVACEADASADLFLEEDP